MAARPNQKQRTRKDLLSAASRLMKSGQKPTLDAVAEAALVSRATAYRYFPNIEALLLEASLDVVAPQAEEVFDGTSPDDTHARLERVEGAFDAMIRANEPALRIMLARALEYTVSQDTQDKLPPRQNRRTPLIEAALEPMRKSFTPSSLKVLTRALAILIGPEAHIACKDVLQLTDAEGRAVRRWAIGALLAAARK